MLSESTEKGDNVRKGIDNNQPVIMYVGNLEYYQGIDLLLESFSVLIGMYGGITPLSDAISESSHLRRLWE